MSAELENSRDADAALRPLAEKRAAALLRLQATRPDLVAFLTLPPREPPRLTRARMAELIQRRVAADGQVTFEDLRRGGFTAQEIEQHFTNARRIAGVEKMVA